jgi:putative transcription factor
MSECELCGSKNANRKTKIDGAILTACEDCVRLGQEIAMVELKPTKRTIPKLEGLERSVKTNFHILIKNERTKKNLTQEDLAKKLNEKSSLIKRMEDGWEPSLGVIKKLEKFFNIKLTEEVEEKQVEKKTDNTKLTIGDVAEIN